MVDSVRIWGRAQAANFVTKIRSLAVASMAAGERLWYAPSAVVYHAIPENRLTQRYLLRFWYDHGRATTRERGYRPSVYGIPRWCFSIPIILARPFLINVQHWLKTEDPKARFYNKGVVWMMMGEMVEMPRVWWTGIKRSWRPIWVKRNPQPPM